MEILFRPLYICIWERGRELIAWVHICCRLLGEKARLEVIKNTAHVPQIECPGQFNNIVKNFLCGPLWLMCYLLYLTYVAKILNFDFIYIYIIWNNDGYGVCFVQYSRSACIDLCLLFFFSVLFQVIDLCLNLVNWFP